MLTAELPPLSPDPTVTPVNPADDVPVPPFSLFLRVRVKAGAIDVGTFCTTDRDAYPKWLTDQQVIFTGATKVKTKTKTATVKKFKLTAPLSSSIPLQTTGSHIVYKFDPSVLQAVTTGAAGTRSCEVSAAKAAGKSNTCTFDNVAGTITVDGNDVLLVKVGKPIISPTITVNFTYTGTPGSTSLTLVESKTHIKVGALDVDVNVDDTYDCIVDPTATSNADVLAEVSSGNPENVCYAGQGVTDPNHDVPIITIDGLL